MHSERAEDDWPASGDRRVLSAATDHPDVDELHRRANAIDNRISLATVYRTVRLLESKGILERRDLGQPAGPL